MKAIIRLHRRTGEEKIAMRKRKIAKGLSGKRPAGAEVTEIQISAAEYKVAAERAKQDRALYQDKDKSGKG